MLFFPSVHVVSEPAKGEQGRAGMMGWAGMKFSRRLIFNMIELLLLRNEGIYENKLWWLKENYTNYYFEHHKGPIHQMCAWPFGWMDEKSVMLDK